jgi:hypothetical protein
MFVQVIRGRAKDESAVRQQWDKWERELKPGANGYSGRTAGIDKNGTFFALIRFESEEAAQRNNERPEQQEWWTETSKFFDDVTFDNLPDASVLDSGDGNELQEVLAKAFLSEVWEPVRQISDGFTRLTTALSGLRSGLQQFQDTIPLGVAAEEDGGSWSDDRVGEALPEGGGWDEKEMGGPIPNLPKPKSGGGSGLEWVAIPLIGLILLGHELLKGPIPIAWGNFPSLLDGEDRITLTVTPGTPGFFTVTLNMLPTMVDWKDVELFDGTNAFRGAAWVQDSKKTDTVSVPNSALAGGHLMLKKAKMFGIHTNMYLLEDRGSPPTVPSGVLTMMANRNVTLNWVAGSG